MARVMVEVAAAEVTKQTKEGWELLRRICRAKMTREQEHNAVENSPY